MQIFLIPMQFYFNSNEGLLIHSHSQLQMNVFRQEKPNKESN